MDYLGRVLTGVRDSPNSSGQFRRVQFRIGKGPIGAVVVDSRSLSGYGMQPSNLPEEENDSRPISFQLSSELLVVRQCRVGGTAVERRYYRWHRRKWYFLKRGMVPPPPVY